LLYFSQVGGIDVQTLLGCRVAIGLKGINGVIGGKPIHLLRGEERSKMPKVDDLFIDIGADNKQVAEALVHVGDYATFSTECAEFGEGMVKGKALASRSGCYALLQVLTMDLPYPLSGVFAVQKEIGLRGARIAGYRVNPHLAFILDSVSCTDLPGVPEEHRGATLGAGPVIRLSDKNGILDLPLSHSISTLATQAGIPYQWQGSSSASSNASAVQLAREGVRVADLAIPCRYADSPINVIAQSDVTNTIKLMRTVLEQATSFNLASQ
jgi:endoglucanase